MRVYAIAYATNIAFDKDPASLSYDQQEMRKHLLRFLQRGDLEPFQIPAKEPSVVNKLIIAFSCIATVEHLSLTLIQT